MDNGGGYVGGRPAQVPAGWFQDPFDWSALRYWDGERWTEHVTAVPAPPPVPVQEATPERLNQRPRRALPFLPRKPLAKLGGGLAGVVLLLAVIGQMGSPAEGIPTPAATPTASSPAPIAAPPTSAAAPSTTTTPAPRPSATPVTPPATTTPGLGGLTLAQATARLATAGLTLGSVGHRPSSAKAGTVLSQTVTAGRKVVRGSRVNLVLASPLPKASPKPATPRPTAKRPVSKPSAPSKPSGGGQSCTPGYDPCLPPASDYDCAGGSGNGPKYVYGVVRVTGSDPYGLDRDGDGWGCEKG